MNYYIKNKKISVIEFVYPPNSSQLKNMIGNNPGGGRVFSLREGFLSKYEILPVK